MRPFSEPWSFTSPDDVLLRLLRIQALTSALSAATSVEDVGRVVVRQVTELMGAAVAVVYFVDEGQQHARMLAGSGIPDTVNRSLAVMPLETPLPLATTLRTGQPLFFESRSELLAAFPHLSASETPRELMQAVVSIPFVERGRVLGGMAISFDTARELTPLDRQLLSSFAQESALALDRAQALSAERSARATVQQLRDRLALLAELDGAMAVAHGLAAMSARISAVIEKLVPTFADVCTVDLVDDRGRFATWAVAHRDPQREALLEKLRADHPWQPSDGSAAARVFHGQQPLWVKNVSEAQLARLPEQGAEFAELARTRRQSALIIPLGARGRAWGVMAFGRDSEYGADDLRFAEDLGRRISLGLDRWMLKDDCDAALGAREEFLSLAAHELKNPLTAAMLHTQSIARRVAAEPQRANADLARSLSATSTALRQTAWLVDAMGVLTQALSASQRTLEPHDVAALAREVVERAATHRASEGLQLALIASGEQRADVSPPLIEAAVDAMLAFASERMPYGRVELHVEGRAEQVSLWVERESEEDHGSEGGAGQEEASGLGVFLVQRVAQAHQGTVHVERANGNQLLVLELPRGSTSRGADGASV